MRNELVKDIRYFLGMTQHEFAEWLGVHPSTIALTEANYRDVSDKLEAKIALKFDVTDAEFLAFRERRRKCAEFKRDKRHFTFCNMQHVRELSELLTNKDAGYLFMLLPYIQFDTNILISQGRNSKPLNIDDIAKIFGIQKRYAKEKIQKFIELGVLAEVDGGAFRINEQFHFRKKAGADSMLVKAFHTPVKNLSLSAADMGVIYKMIPYVHYESNLLVDNPDDKNPQLLNKTNLAKKIGMSRQKFDEVIKRLVKANVIDEVKRAQVGGDGREVVIMFNPQIITRRGFNG